MTEFDVIIKEAKKYGIPVTIPQRLKTLDDTDFEEGESAYYRDIVNNIVLPKDIYRRLKSGTLKDVDLSTIFNEMEHAYYDQEIEYNTKCCSWIMDIIKAEAKTMYNNDTDYLDEAMSETFDALASEFTRFFLFKDKLNLGYGRNAQEPAHTDKGEKWYGDKYAVKKMSKAMYYTTLYVFFNGCSLPPGYTASGKTVAQHQAAVKSLLVKEKKIKADD